MQGFANLLLIPTYFAEYAKSIVDWNFWNAGFTSYNIMETASNKLSERFPEWSNRFPSQIKIISIAKDLIIIPSAIATIGSVTQTVSLITKKFSILPVVLGEDALFIPLTPYAVGFNVAAWVGMAGSTYAVYRLTKVANNYFWKEKEAEKLINDKLANQEVTYNHPTNEFLEENFLVVRIACGVAMFALNPLSPLNIINIGLQSYSLLNIARRQWIKFQIEVPTQFEGIKSFICSIFLRIHPIPVKSDTKEEDKENCAICLNNLDFHESPDSNASVLLCNRHAIHLSCVSQYITANLQKIEKGFGNTLTRREDYNLISMLFGDNITYRTKLDKEILPHCPTCQVAPDYRVEGQVLTMKDKRYRMNIELTKKPA